MFFSKLEPFRNAGITVCGQLARCLCENPCVRAVLYFFQNFPPRFARCSIFPFRNPIFFYRASRGVLFFPSYHIFRAVLYLFQKFSALRAVVYFFQNLASALRAVVYFFHLITFFGGLLFFPKIFRASRGCLLIPSYNIFLPSSH